MPLLVGEKKDLVPVAVVDTASAPAFVAYIVAAACSVHSFVVGGAMAAGCIVFDSSTLAQYYDDIWVCYWLRHIGKTWDLTLLVVHIESSVDPSRNGFCL